MGARAGEERQLDSAAARSGPAIAGACPDRDGQATACVVFTVAALVRMAGRLQGLAGDALSRGGIGA